MWKTLQNSVMQKYMKIDFTNIYVTIEILTFQAFFQKTAGFSRKSAVEKMFEKMEQMFAFSERIW